MERKQTYEQALAAEKNLAKGRAMQKEAAARRNGERSDMTDEDRIAFMDKFSTKTLEWMLSNRHAPALDKKAAREALARRAS